MFVLGKKVLVIMVSTLTAAVMCFLSAQSVVALELEEVAKLVPDNAREYD